MIFTWSLLHVVVSVVCSLEYSVLRDVGESLIHPSTSTSIIICVTVKKLLDWEFSKLWHNSILISESLSCWCSTECPTSSARALISWSCHITLFVPVFVIWEFWLFSKNSSLNGVHFFCFHWDHNILHSITSCFRNNSSGIFWDKFFLSQVRELIDL